MFSKLNSKGIAHYLLPVLAVLVIGIGGTATLVANRANLSDAAAAVNSKNPQGYMLLYSSQGKYNRAVIVPLTDGTNSPVNMATQTCNGKKSGNGAGPFAGWAIKLTSSKNGAVATKVRCSAANYRVFFLKPSESAATIDENKTQHYVSVGLQTNYCSFVHQYGMTRVEAVKNGKCTGDNNPTEDNIVKITPVLISEETPNPSTIGKKTTWTLTLKDPSGEALSPEECAGSVVVNAVDGPTSNNKDYHDEFPIRYNRTTKACLYRVTYKQSGSAGTYKRTYTFKGNKFLNPATATYTYTIKK